jgi:hypothetical protein
MMMPSSRTLLSSRSSSIAARAFAPSKPKDGGILQKTSTANMSTTKGNGAPLAKGSEPISLQTHFVVGKEGRKENALKVS